MPGATARARGPRPPGDAWERFARPALWPSWAPHIAAVRCRDDRIRVGGHGRVRAVGGLVARFRVDAVDEPAMCWSWTVRAVGLRVRLEHGVDAAGDGSEAWARILAPRPLALLYAPIAALALRRLVAA